MALSMSEGPGKLLEGVFAISKPPSLSSAQVLRELQSRFSESRTFAPLLKQTREAQEKQDFHQPKRRRRNDDNPFKMGHGGTLDPLATGVLIVGIGRGTKHLSAFLNCTKTYETVVLFGKSTDTYDVAGKVVAEAATEKISRALVEEHMSKFRGNRKQVPPMHSAIKMQGMKLYEYARTGQELPRAIESRDVTVSECSLLRYFEPGEHEFRWPAQQATEEEKIVASKLRQATQTDSTEDEAEKPCAETVSPQPVDHQALSPKEKADLHTHLLPTQEELPANAPAASVRLTVSSGFYVRSFAHDLGLACGSYGIMAALVRSRQGDFTNTNPAPAGLIPALTYEDLNAGEEVWGPKISPVLEQWTGQHPIAPTQERLDDRDRPRKDHRRLSPSRPGTKRSWKPRKDHDRRDAPRRRNSSSPE